MGKFLDKQGVTLLWGKTKELLNSKGNEILNTKGQPNGLASLDGDGKLEASQLPSLKTINGESIVGSGNITIDLGIYQIVESLPESNQNPNKIYLVLSETSGTQNLYTEYLWTGSAWEQLGEYKAAVDLTPYVKNDDLANKVAQAGFLKESDLESKVGALGFATETWVNSQRFVTWDDMASGERAGLMSSAHYNLLTKMPDTIVTKLSSSRTADKVVISCEQTNFDNPEQSGVKEQGPIEAATQEYAGVMSAADKTKLDNIDPSKLVTTDNLEDKLEDVGEFVTFDDIVSTDKAGLLSASAYQNLTDNKPVNNIGFSVYESKLEVSLGGISVLNPASTKPTTKLVDFPMASAEGSGAMTSAQYNKLDAIAANATADEALTAEELAEIFV